MFENCLKFILTFFGVHLGGFKTDGRNKNIEYDLKGSYSSNC